MKVQQLTFRLDGFCPLLMGAYIAEEKASDETNQQLEERTWKRRCNVDHEGHLVVPSVAVHRSLIFGGKKLRMKIKGEGKAEYTGLIESGIITESPYFQLHNGKKVLTKDDVIKLSLRVDPTGKRGGKTGGKQVEKHFPMINPGWWCDVVFIVLNEKLTLEILKTHAEAAGMYDGLGSMRAGNGGPNGRYVCRDFKLVPKTL